MTTYANAVVQRESELETARSALAGDVAAAVARKHWEEFLRDRHDVEQFVEHIELLRRDDAFIAAIRAAADRAREAQGRTRGRPRKNQTQTNAAKLAKSEPGPR